MGCLDGRSADALIIGNPATKNLRGECVSFATFLLFFSACAVIIIQDKNKEVIFMAVKIEKDTIIGDVLDIAPQSAPLFFAIGMHCLGCPSSRGETVEEACMVHGVDADAFLAQVNRFIEASEEAEKAK